MRALGRSQDARLLFQLKRQEFIECLRNWEKAGWKQALGARSLFPPGSNLIPWQLKSTCLLVHMHSHTHHHPDGHAVLALAYSAAAGCCAACARRELAPLALYAHPEAYSDFKQTMQVRCCCVPAEQWHASCKFLMHSPMPFSTHNTHVLLASRETQPPAWPAISM